MPRPTRSALKNMTKAALVRMINTHGQTGAAEILGVPRGTISSRANRLREKGAPLADHDNGAGRKTVTGFDEAEYSHRQQVEITNGIAIVAGDFHYWPGPASTAHRALVKFIREEAPQLVVLNGDVVDMAAVSRHAPIGWEMQPTVIDEIEVAQERLAELLGAMTRKTKKTWNLGNHDARFESRLADKAPEFAKVRGIHLQDHFPEWEPAWGTWINDDVVTKHRWKGGEHATWNNTIKSGKTMITGHLHSAQVRSFTDYNGTRWGVDHGVATDPFGPQFIGYTEDNPRNWVSGFCVLTFLKGRLLWPELVTKFDDSHVEFRGKIIRV